VMDKGDKRPTHDQRNSGFNPFAEETAQPSQI
jgi:hypothetical protein